MCFCLFVFLKNISIFVTLGKLMLFYREQAVFTNKYIGITFYDKNQEDSIRWINSLFGIWGEN